MPSDLPIQNVPESFTINTWGMVAILFVFIVIVLLRRKLPPREDRCLFKKTHEKYLEWKWWIEDNC